MPNRGIAEGSTAATTFEPNTVSTEGMPRHVAAPADFATIAERARATNLERAKRIEAALLAAADGRAEDEFAAAIRAAHQVAGSAGTFGLTRASELAREIEDLLAGGTFAEPATLLSAFTAVESLAEELRREPELQRATPVAPGSRPCRILIAHPDAEQASRLTLAARARAWATESVATAEAAVQAVAEGGLDAFVVDLSLPGLWASEVLSRARATQPPTPTLLLVPDDDFVDRVEAWRVGADGFISGELTPERILAAIARLLERAESARSRVLALDDDPLVLEMVRGAFHDSNVDVITVANPLRFWDQLTKVRPDLVLLDVDMPAISGPEVCRMLRADAQWADLPVIFLTGKVPSDSVHSLFAAGADDYVPKPIVGPELVARVENRLERVRLARRMAQTDQPTGLLNRSTFESEYPGLARNAAGLGQPVALALLAVDDLRKIIDEHGAEAGDATLERLASLLRSHVHAGDLTGRWSEDTVAVAMPGMHRDDAIARLTTLLEAFAAARVPGGPAAAPSFTAVVAEEGPDGASLRELRTAVGATLGRAASAGLGRRVLPVGWRRETAADVVDVLFVEDDDTLAEVLGHSLQTRGLRGQHLADGQEALERLTGRDPLTARVVLLDVDLPGLNGLDLLRALSERDVLTRTRVVMLTARGNEADVLTALNLGAFDHVSKPFSLPVLMHRIRRALDE